MEWFTEIAKKKSTIFAVSMTVIIITLVLYLFTSFNTISGGFYNPKAILLQENETRKIEIITDGFDSIPFQDGLLISLQINDERIGVMPKDNDYSLNGISSSTDIYDLYGLEKWSNYASIIQPVRKGHSIFQLKILNNSIPNGEYELKISTSPSSLSFLTASKTIPIYIGYQIKDKDGVMVI